MGWYEGDLIESTLGWVLATLIGLQLMAMTAVMVLLLVDRKKTSRPHV